MTEDRRAFQRFSLHVQVLVLQQGSPFPLIATTTNISRDGFLCSMDTELAVGDRLRCLIVLADPVMRLGHTAGLCINGEVEVVHVTPDREGNSFATGFHMTAYRIESRGAVGKFPDVVNSQEKTQTPERISIVAPKVELAKGHSTG